MEIKYDANGLIPAICQDADNGEILMMAWMNEEAVRLTVKNHQAYFWSRSRKEIWHKGATSGSFLMVQDIWVDCDSDSLLLKVHPAGPACHTGKRSCFFRKLEE